MDANTLGPASLALTFTCVQEALRALGVRLVRKYFFPRGAGAKKLRDQGCSAERGAT